MTSTSSYQAHSADVSMRLLIASTSLRIARMGQEFFLIDADRAYDPGHATVRMRVDADESEWDVYLPQGIAAAGMQKVVVTLPPGQTWRQERDVAELVER